MSSKSACQKRSLPFASWESHFLSCLTEEGVCCPAEHIFKRTFRKFSDTSVTDRSLLPGHHRDHADSCLLTAPHAWSLIFFYSITPALPPKPCPSLRPPQPCEHQIPWCSWPFEGLVRTVGHHPQTLTSFTVVLPWKGTVVARVGTLDTECV